VVDLVDDQRPAAFGGRPGQRDQLGTVEQRAGGVGRGRDHRRARRRIPVFLDVRGVQLVVALDPCRHRHRFTVAEPHEVTVARVAGVGHQHLLAGIEQYAERKLQRPGGTRRHGDTLGRHVDTVVVAVVA
jgi:hypothetical protein